MNTFSIITVCYNAASFLERTIDSVLNQTYNEFEFILIDGGSNDISLEIVKSYEPLFEAKKIFFHWISESDKGIFDAMNKGISLSTGRWVNFMNAGDSFVNSEVLFEIAQNLNDDIALIYGNTINNNSILRFPFSLDCVKTGGMPACHQSMFYNKTLLKNEFQYPLKFKYFEDIELTMRIYKKGFKIKYLNLEIANYLGGGVSSEINWEARKAKFYYLFKHFGIKGVLLGLLKSARILQKERAIRESIILGK